MIWSVPEKNYQNHHDYCTKRRNIATALKCSLQVQKPIVAHTQHSTASSASISSNRFVRLRSVTFLSSNRYWGLGSSGFEIATILPPLIVIEPLIGLDRSRSKICLTCLTEGRAWANVVRRQCLRKLSVSRETRGFIVCKEVQLHLDHA